MKKYAIGTDIGGSHISCAVIDLENESIEKESFSTVKIDNQASADEILNRWVLALKQSLKTINASKLAGIGFAMPGPFDYEKGLALFHGVAKYEGLYGINVKNQLIELLGLHDDVDIRFMNDATAFAVGEAWMGNAAGKSRSVSITLGTGFGSAFIDEGVPVVEREDVPEMGCVWHLPFKEGIADDSFSTRWFIKRFEEKFHRTVEGAKEVAEESEKNPEAKEIFVEFGQNLGSFLGPWLNKFEAETLVIGGNVSGAYNFFGPCFEEYLKKINVKTEIKLSKLMEDAAIIGSARMFDENFWEKIKPLLSKM